MPLRGRQRPIDVDAVGGECKGDGIDEVDIYVTEGEASKTRIKEKSREVSRTKPNQLTFVDVQRPINTLHPRVTSTLDGRPNHLSISSEDFSAPSPQSGHASLFKRMWEFPSHAASTGNNPTPMLDMFATTGPVHPPSTNRNDALHLLYPDEHPDHDPQFISQSFLPLKDAPYFMTDTMAQIKLHQIFVGVETVLADGMAIRFNLQVCPPSELATIIISETREVRLDLSSGACSKIQVSLRTAPYFIEIKFTQHAALPKEIMDMRTLSVALGTGWVRFSFAKPDPSRNAPVHQDVLLAVDKCLQGVFGERVSEAPANDMRYIAEGWKPYIKSGDGEHSLFCSSLASMLMGSKGGKSQALSTPLQTGTASTGSSGGVRRSSRLICYGSRRRQSMSGSDIQGTTPSPHITSPHTDRSDACPLFIYPEDDPHGILVTTNELARLEPGIYLNDTLVELDVRWIFEDVRPSLRGRSFYFSSFFYRKLTATHHHSRLSSSNSNSFFQESRNQLAYRQVHKWTRHVNIFEHDFLFIPICEHLHWYLIIVAHPKAILTGRKITAQQDEKQDALGHSVSSMISSDVFETADFSTPIPFRQGGNELSAVGEKIRDAVQSVMPIDSSASEDELMVVDKTGSRSIHSQGTTKHAAVMDLVSPQQASESDNNVILSDDDDHQGDPECLILCYDSLGSSRSKQTVFNNIKQYLVAEAADKLGEEADARRSHGVSLRGPIQTNSTDCGLFMLQAIEAFLSEEDPDAWIDGVGKSSDHPKWFPPSKAIARRQALRERVMRTAEQFSIKADVASLVTNDMPVEDEDDLIILSGPPSPLL